MMMMIIMMIMMMMTMMMMIMKFGFLDNAVYVALQRELTQLRVLYTHQGYFR